MNKLYEKVFGIDTSVYNPQTNNFLILYSDLQNNEFSNSLIGDIKHYIGQNCMRVVTEESFGDSRKDQYFYNLSGELNKTYGFGTRKAYVLLFDLRESVNAEKIISYLNAVKPGFSQGDSISVVSIVSENDNKDESLKQIEFMGKVNWGNSIMFYFFPVDRFHTQELRESVSALCSLYSEKTLYDQLQKNKIMAMSQIDNSVDNNMGEEGRKIIRSKQPMIWSGISADYNDSKVIFLKQYVRGLYDNIALLDSFDFYAECNACYSRIIGLENDFELEKLLRHAVKCIPMVTNSNPVGDLSLENYFIQIYGNDGPTLVDLTLRVNLSMQPKYPFEFIETAAKSIFDSVKIYHSEDLCSEVIKKLADYINNELNLTIAERQQSINSYVRNTEYSSVELNEYIKKYIDYYSLIRKQEFWEDVLDYFKNHSDVFADACKISKQSGEYLTKWINSHMFDKPLDNIEYPKYTAYQFMTLEENQALCTAIAEEYSRYVERNVINVEGVGELQDIYPSFFPEINICFQDYRYECSIRNTYRLKIHQRIGKYFVFE